ncbi:esterase [Paenibacillus sp. PK3_47]|uniref:alpha/beta hydrolase fold domain-containing protein n=1 Tax=Paenibacillus sp. PK3_47 TaxID=2072642 RepID=UPI00201D4BD3|nr:alpha/beta hydrolase [Paenibacillus sp. PK3_47]UQZ32234.1 esterase [Paenibacillus sp. PK3_47]
MAIHIYNQKRSIPSFIFEKVIRLSSIKKGFSSVENTAKLVKAEGAVNIKRYTIKKAPLSSEVQERSFEGMQVFTLNDQQSRAQKVILYIHGGAWTFQPLTPHWRFMDRLAQTLNAKIIAPIYPKVPHYSYKDTYPKLLDLYKEILESVERPSQLTIMGDSSGGNIALGLAHLLKMNVLPQPKDIILFSACVDMALDNPEMPEYEKKDPMLAAEGVEVITELWADDKTVDDPIISPIHSDFTGFPRMAHFVGTHEGLYPDAVRLDDKLSAQGVEIDTFVYPKMNHVFVILPIPEAKDARQKIVTIINN